MRSLLEKERIQNTKRHRHKQKYVSKLQNILYPNIIHVQLTYFNLESQSLVHNSKSIIQKKRFAIEAYFSKGHYFSLLVCNT